MRHGEAGADCLAARNVDDHAAAGPVVPPAVGDVGGRHRGDVGRGAVAHREAVEVAAVLGRKARHKGRPPEGTEAVGLAHRREAGEQRVGEDDSARAVEGDVVDFEVAGEVRHLRHVDGVVAVLHRCPLRRVDEGGDLVHRRDG
jgi:hypothetical protein